MVLSLTVDFDCQVLFVVLGKDPSFPSSGSLAIDEMVVAVDVAVVVEAVVR